MNYKEALEHCIFKYLSGSHCYGTNVPESDEDYRGVFIAPLIKAFELFNTSYIGRGSIGQQLKNTLTNLEGNDFETAKFQLKCIIDENEQGDLNLSVGTVSNPGNDDELQELRKFFKLAADCNPNIIEFLFVEKGIIIEHPIWIKIRNHKDLFLSKKARFTFSGYAISQLKRIQTHRGYLLNPKEKPLRKDFGLPETTIIPSDLLRAILSLRSEWVQPDVREIVLCEQKFHLALREFRSYEKWKTERNEKRRLIESKCGFDGKHASHLLRLVRMAKEILSTGKVNVHRHNIDADELKSFRNGERSYDELMKITENIDKDLDELYQKSVLRKSADHKKIAELYKEICEEYYGIKL